MYSFHLVNCAVISHYEYEPEIMTPNNNLSSPLVNVENLCVEKNGRSILKDVSFQLVPGELVTLIGPNGAGKSTLIHTLLGLNPPTTGTITLAKNLRIGYMPQKIHISETFPIDVSRFLKLSPKAKNQEIKDTLELVGISHLAKTSLHSLSGGEMQRVLLAKALLRSPNLLILDEPGQGVDVNGQQELYQLINDVKNKIDCAILMVSHDLHLVMATTDHVICLNHHICCSGTPDSISSNPQYIALFGQSLAASIALYTHHHDHKHDIKGNVIPTTENHSK